MATVHGPGCAQIYEASWWIHYIFKADAAALVLLLLLYIILLALYILYNLHLDAFSSLNHFIANIANSLRRTSFYRQYYFPFIRHYACMFLLFIVLFPISLMYYDSLFQYRNDCTSTANSWCTFSVIFLIHFCYHTIKFILFSPDFGVSITNDNQHEATPFATSSAEETTAIVDTNTDDTLFGEADHTLTAPSVPSMPAPRAMQDALPDDYEEQERGAIADYNPFDSGPEDNEPQNNTDYIVIDHEAQNEAVPHHKISVMHENDPTNNTQTLHTTAGAPESYQTQIPPPPPALPAPDIIPPPPDMHTEEYMQDNIETENHLNDTQTLKAAEYGNTIEILQLITYLKYITVFFMVVAVFAMVTSWKFIPYYAINISSFSMFYVFVAPFILMYRVNIRFMDGDYYTRNHVIRILNDMPFVLFLLKLSCAVIILNYCITLSVTNHSILIAILFIILPICCVYPYKIVYQISSQLESMYDSMAMQQLDDNMDAFMRPIIPFGEMARDIQHDEYSREVSTNLVERNTRRGSDSIRGMYDPPETSRLESVDLSHSEHDEVYDIKHDEVQLQASNKIATMEYYGDSFWIVHILCIVNVLIILIVGLVQIASAHSQLIWSRDLLWHSAAIWLVIHCVWFILSLIYNAFVTIYPASLHNKGIYKICHFGADTKRRLMIFLKTNLVLLQLNVILVTKQDGTKAVLTVLYLVSCMLLIILTHCKIHPNNYYNLLKLPVKSPKLLLLSYRISYAVSILVMFCWIIHVNVVNNKQSLMIYSYVGLPFIWWFWSQLYNNEICNFVVDLQNRMNNNVKEVPTTYGSLYVLSELIMISSFVVFVLCCALASKSYDGARDGASLFFLAIYLLLSLIIFINSIASIFSMQARNEKGYMYKAAVFEPVLKESLLTQ